MIAKAHQRAPWRRLALSAWENEGGATFEGPRAAPPHRLSRILGASRLGGAGPGKALAPQRYAVPKKLGLPVM